MVVVNKSQLEEIDQHAREKITVFKSDLRDDGSSITRNFSTIRNLSGHIATDYGDRYLLELIQNAYDALLDEEKSGCIKICYAPHESEWGTLYIANGGRPFQWGNVESICLIGQSDKPAGENIGNKGLGFRSVQYVSDAPRIYSLAGEGENNQEYGYCFRFAQDGDFSRWTDDPIVLEQLPLQLPPFCIPFPLDTIPEQVRALIVEGFVSVIAVPIRNETAKKSVHKQIEQLRLGNAPLLLFLQRLELLEVVVNERPDLSFSLTRSATDMHLSGAAYVDTRLSLVALNKTDRYLVAWDSIPEEKVKAVIEESIEQRQLHPSWSKWEGDGELAVAARIGQEVTKNILYTFLPMGDAAECPFQGYLHGAFFPKSDRTSLHADSPLNAMYIKEALRLSVQAVLAVRAWADVDDAYLAHQEYGKIIVDLLSWREVASINGFNSEDYGEHLRENFKIQGLRIDEADILPVRQGGDKESWSSAEKIWQWDDGGLHFFRAEKVSVLGNVPILAEELGNNRIARVKFVFQVAIGKELFIPKVVQLSEIIEKGAEELRRKKVEVFQWNLYYQDLLSLVKKYSGLKLFGQLNNKKILLCSGNRLRAGYSPPEDSVNNRRKKRKRTELNIGNEVFSPSERVVKGAVDDRALQELLEVPQSLAKGFSFLSQRLDWYGELEEVRQYFEQQKLIRKYDARELIVNVSRIQKESKEKNARYEGLVWLFKLYRARGEHFENAFSAVDIEVPVGRNRWVAAKKAYFSSGWKKIHKINEMLEQFFQGAAQYSPEIQELQKKLLRPPSSKPFSLYDLSEWYKFLELIGVNTGLKPIQLKTRAISSMPNLSAKNLCEHLGVQDRTRTIWEAAIEGKQTYCHYRLEKGAKIYWWPGQDDYAFFPDEIKKLYARLLIEWLASTEVQLSNLQFEYHHHHFVRAQRISWPSPFLAFLREEAWFPLEIMRGVEQGETFKQLRDVWLPEEDSTRHRPFMPQITANFGIRKGLAQEGVHDNLVEWGGAKVLNSETSLLDQVGMLGEIFHNNQVEDYAQREFFNLYNSTWERITDAGTKFWPQTTRLDWLLTRHLGRYDTYPLTARAKAEKNVQEMVPVYVLDDDNTLVCTLLEELGNHIFDLEGTKAGVAGIIKNLLGSAFIGTSTIPVSILIDDADFAMVKSDCLPLIEMFPALPQLLCLAMESLRGTAAQQLPADRGELLARLRQIRVVVARRIGFLIANKPAPLPRSHYGVFGHFDEDVPYLMFATNGDLVSWAYMRQASSALSILLEQRDLASALNIVCSAMERRQSTAEALFNKQQHLDFFCRELHLTENQAIDALAVEAGDKQRIERLLGPLVLYCAGEDAYEEYVQRSQAAKTLDEVINVAEPFFLDGPINFQDAYGCARESNSFEFMLNRLDLEFATFNTCLMKTGGEAITYPDQHQMVMAEFLEENRDRLVALLQVKYRPIFEQQGDLQEYMLLRKTLLTLEPQVEWLISYKIPPVEVMKEMVKNWLVEKNIRCNESDLNDLPGWSRTLRNNEKILKKFIEENGKKIKVWCIKQNIPRGSVVWYELESNLGEIKNALEKVGALDFSELQEDVLLNWLLNVGVWPEKMPLTLDLELLGLTEKDIANADKVETQEREEREKAQRSVQFGATVLDPKEVQYEEIDKLIQNEMPKKLRKISLNTFADMEIPAERDGLSFSNSRSKKNGGAGALKRLPQEKTELIGFLGECVVFHWLSKRYPKKDIEKTWVSKNRERLFCEMGNDSLGYDFEIKTQKRLFLEVKSSLQDPMEFEMGETEVIKARDIASKGGEEYRIVYVCNLAEPSEMKILMLPNPFSEEGKKCFPRPKEKFKYRFGLK